MKLIQYRFSSDALGNAPKVGRLVQELFETKHDLDLRATYVLKGDVDKLVVRKLAIDQVEKVVAESFLQSFSDVVDYYKYASIKSNLSCRFVVIEDDGLLRVCHAQDDAVIDFVGLRYTCEDVSELLVRTDLFD